MNCGQTSFDMYGVVPQGDTTFYWTVGILMYHGHGLLVNLSVVTRGKSISDPTP